MLFKLLIYSMFHNRKIYRIKYVKDVTLADFLRNDGQNLHHETTKDHQVDHEPGKCIIR